jgi:hypothetical protein
MRFSAEALDVADYHAAVELYFERGWTDGLAIVPPTEELVEAMVHTSGRQPEEELGEIPPAQGIATIEKLAINSVMAGCRPQYFPIILAAVEAMLEPEHNLNGVQTTTHCCVPLLIVNGPLVQDLKFNAAETAEDFRRRAEAAFAEIAGHLRLGRSLLQAVVGR